MPRHGIKINRFDGGLNTKTSPETGELNESPDLYNVDFSDVGAVETRKGRSLVGYMGSAEVCLLHSFLSDIHAPQLLGMSSGSIQYYDGSILPCSGGTGIMTAGVSVYATNAQNCAFLGNGAKVYKWDGETITRWGTPQAAPAPYPQHYAGTACTHPGYVGYKIAYEDIFGTEGLAGSYVSSYDLTGASGNMGFTLAVTAPAASYGAAYINVYRKASGQTQWYRLTSQANVGSAITVIDDFSDNLTSAHVYDTLVDPTPVPLSVFQHHIGYMFGAGPDYPTRLYYSDINMPTKWASDQFIRVGDGDGYPIKGLVQFGTNLLITKEDGKGSGSCWLLYTPSGEPTTWQIARMNVAYGSIAAKALTRFATFLMLLNKTGIYDLAEGTVGESILNPMSYKIEPDAMAFSDDYIKDSVAVTWQNKVYMTVPVDGAIRNNRIYVYDFVQGQSEVSKATGAWSRWNNMDMAQLAVHEDELYAGDYYGGLHKLDQGYADGSTAINSYFKTMLIHGLPEHADNNKVWRFLYLTVETPGDWTMSLTYGDDLSETTGTTTTLDLDPNAPYWGSATFGVDHYGRTTIRRNIKVTLINQVSKKLQVKFSTNTANHNWKVYDMLCEYNLQGVR